MRIVTTPHGHKSIELTEQERTVRLHSFFDPAKEAARAVESFSSNEGRLILVAGLGLAWHIRALHERFPERRIVVIERSPEVITACRVHAPENIFDAAIINSDVDIEQYLASEDIAAFKGFDLFIHRQSYSIDPQFYDLHVRAFGKAISSRISDLLTRCEFEEKWVLNSVANLPSLFTGVPVKALFNKFKGYTGILVSAGPSLRKNVALLEKAYNRALIVCVDTAYKVLYRSGIRPHLVMVLDAQKHSQLHFLGTPHDVPLLADIVSSPLVLRSWRGRPILSTTAKYYEDSNGKTKRETTPFVDFIEKYSETPGDIQSGGSVATSLFDFLLNAGCSRIVLVGQDLAYTGREIHSSGTYHNDRWLKTTDRFLTLEGINQAVIRKRRIRRVASVNGRTVITDFVLDLYRHWFEDSAGRVPIEVINASADGAAIANTKQRDLGELLDTIPERALAPQKIIESVIDSYAVQDNKRMTEALRALIRTGKAIPALSDSEAIALAARDEMAGVFAPFIKKSDLCAMRSNMDADKKEALIGAEIKRAAQLLAAGAERSLQVMEKYEK